MRTRLLRSPLAVAAAAALALAGCAARPTVVERPVPNLCAPAHLSAQVGGNGAVVLSWTACGDVSSVVRFRIYKANGTSATAAFAVIDSLTAPAELSTETALSKIVQGLAVGSTYQLTVAEVDSRGIEGRHATPLVVTPSRYSISLSDCSTGSSSVTKSPSVCIRLFALRSTVTVEVADDASFTENVEVFDFPQTNPPTIQHRLVDDDPSHQGSRTIYARFTTDTGAQSAVVSDQIRYDAYAAIDSVVVTPRDHVFVTGETIHFAAYAAQRETGGSVSFSLNNPSKSFSVPKFANDNGTNGDRVAGDGVYEVDYTVNGQTQNEITDATPQGVFTDPYGNSSAEQRSDQVVTVNVPPPALRLNTPAPFSNGVSLSYTASTVADWASYETYYSTDSLALAGAECATCPVPPPSPCTGICHWDSWNTDPTRSSFTISGLTACTRYFFRIFVRDTGGLSTGSNIVGSTTTCAPSFVAPPTARPPRLPGARVVTR